MDVTQVAVIGKHAVLSEAICDELAGFEDIHAVAADAHAGDIASYAASYAPDVLVVDVALLSEGGESVIEEVARLPHPPAIVLLSDDLLAAGQCPTVAESLRGGVTALVLKMPPVEELALAVRHAKRGERWISPPVLTQVLLADTQPAPEGPAHPEGPEGSEGPRSSRHLTAP